MPEQALSAGPELNALVHTEVLELAGDPMDYSTEPNYAWIVERHVRRRFNLGCVVGEAPDGSGREYCSFYSSFGGVIFTGHGAHEAEAICLAALKVVRESREQHALLGVFEARMVAHTGEPRPADKRCACCPGRDRHIHGSDFEAIAEVLDGWGKPIPNARAWISELASRSVREHEGKRIRITVEVIEEGS